MSRIWELTGSEITDAVRSRRLSATEVTQAHLARLDEVNPTINAVVDAFPEEALASARQVDEQISNGEDPGSLCGVPVTIKVNVDQKDHATTNGLRLLKDNVADSDSPVVSNIRKAGGVILGRTSTPAFSMRWFTKSELYGQTLNPRDLSITPGGSSGGAAAAVASGICAIGHGTDIGGSVRYPAYACGVHGLRPSLGRVPAYNASGADRMIGAQIMAVSGPIARSIEDIRISLQALSSNDPRDPWYTPGQLGQGGFEKRAALTFAPDGMAVCDDVRTALADAAQKLIEAGWQVDEVPCPPMRPAADINAKMWMAEMMYSAHDMVAQEGDADAQFVYQQMLADAGEVDLGCLMEALQRRAGLVREWEVFHRTYPVSICPVSGQLPFEQQLDVSSEVAFQKVYEAQLPQRALPTLGLPALAVATGKVGTIPVGVQLVAGRFREDILLAAGADIERAGSVPAVANPV